MNRIDRIRGRSLPTGLRLGVLALGTALGLQARSAGAVAVVATTNALPVNATSLTIAPATVSGGNVLVAHVVQSGTLLAPSGPNASWTLQTTTLSITGNCILTTWTHTVTAGETPSYQWTKVGTKVDWSGGITQYSGVDISCPVGAKGTAAGTTVTAGKRSTFVLPTITTLVPGAMLDAGYGIPIKNKSFTLPLPWARQIVAKSGSKVPSSGSGDLIQVLAGGTGTTTVTANMTANAYVADLIELDPPDTTGVSLTPVAMSFSTNQGASPADQTFTITNAHLRTICANQSYAASVTYSAGWGAANLPAPSVGVVNLAQGQTSAAITVSIASTLLAAGTYTAVITITDASGNFAVLNITLSIACSIQREANVATATAGAATALTLTEPAGWSNGDAVVATLVADTMTAPATPAGWTLVGSNTTAGLGMWMYRITRSGSATATWTGFTSGKLAGTMAAYLNANTTLMLDAPSTPFTPAVTSSGNGNVDANACTTGLANTEVVAAYAINMTTGGAALTVGAGLTSVSGNVATGAGVGDLILNLGSDLVLAAAGTPLSKTGTVAPAQAAAKLGALCTLAPANVPPAAAVTRLPVAPVQGDTVTYTIVVTNPAGNGPLTTLMMSDTLPAGVTFVSLGVDAAGVGLALSSNAGAGAVEGASGTLATPLAPGNSVTFTLVGTLGCGAAAAQSTTVLAQTGGTCGNPAGVLNAFIPGVVAAPGVAVTHDLTTPTQGDTVTYSIVVTNTNASAPLNALTFSDTLPGAISFSSLAVDGAGAGLTLTTSAGAGAVEGASGTLTTPLAAGNSVTFTLVGIVGCGAGGSPSNQAYAQTAAGCQKTLSAADVFPVAAASNPLTVSVSHTPASPAPGATVTYMIVVVNPGGNGALNGLVISDTLPAGISFVSLEAGSDGSGDGLTLSANAGTGVAEGAAGQFLSGLALGSGASFTLTLTGTVTCAATGSQALQGYAETPGACQQTLSAADSFSMGGTALAITAVSPACGVATGGFTLTITGTFGTGGCVPTGVTMGTEAAAILGTPTVTTILATAPSFTGTAVGTALDVTVATASGSASLVAAYTSRAAPTVTSIAPTCGVTTGGFTMTITGTFATGACAPVAVTIGGVTAAIQGTPTATTVLVAVPGGLTAGTAVAVSVTDGTGNGSASASLAAAYTPRAAPTVTSAAPTCGPTAGGFTMTITGTFAAGACAPESAIVGGVAAVIQGMPTATTVLVAVPGGLTAGTAVDVTVTDGTGNGSATATLVIAYTPRVPPVISGIAPVCGVTTGGFTMTITGTFTTGSCAPVAATVGGIAAMIQGTPTVTTVLVAVPGGLPAGTAVDVTVTGGTGNGSASDTLAAAYTPRAAPTVTAVAPVCGVTTGGFTMTITGTFATGACAPVAVTIGGVAAAIQGTPTTTTVLVAVPGGLTAGTAVDVTVTDGTGNGSASASLAAAYTPRAAPTITGVAPTCGVTAGGFTMTITGTFAPGPCAPVAVTIGGLAAVIEGTPTATTVLVAVPGGLTAGTAVDVVVTDGTGNGSAGATLAGAFSPVTMLGTLAASAALPVRVSVGQWFTVSLTVTNTGDADVTGLAPTVAVGPGAALVTLETSPAGGVTLAPGAMATFNWTYSAAGTGLIAFTATATGATCQATLLLGAATVSATAQVPAGLDVSVLTALPTSICGQPITIVLTVTNTGGADAVSVTGVPDLFVEGPAATLVSSPSPMTLAGGASANLTWVYDAGSLGNIRFTATVTGFDGNSLAVLASGPRVSNTVAVNSAAVLDAAGSALPAVTVGMPIQVVLTVTNAGQALASAVVPALVIAPGAAAVTYVSGPTPAGPIALAATATQRFTWAYTAAAPGLAVFTLTAAGTTCSGAGIQGMAVVTTLVQSPAALAAAGVIIRDPLCTGDATLVTLTVTNTGGASAVLATAPDWAPTGTGGVTKVGGPSPVFPATITGNSMQTFTWTYSGSSAGIVILTTTVTAQDGNSGAALSTGPVTTAPATVQVPGALAGALAVTPAFVSPGVWFTVALTVTNTGGADVSGIAPAIAVGPGAALVVQEAVPSGGVTLAAGAAATFAWTYSASGSGVVTLTATATGSTCAATPVSASAGISLGVQTGASLFAAVDALGGPLCMGDTILVTLTVTNAGQGDALLVAAPDFAVAGGGSVTLGAGPVPAFPVTLPGLSSRVFTWTYTGAAAGAVFLTTTVSAQDAGSGAAIMTGPTTAGGVTVLTPGALAAAVAISPAGLSTGQWFAVTLTMTNTGGATVTGVTPAIAVGPGAALVVQQAAPAGGVTLGAGTATTFAWTYSAGGAGSVTFTATVTGATCASTAVSASASRSVTIQAAAVLIGGAVAYRDPLCLGDTTLVTLTVTNTGGADAILVAAPDFTAAGAGGLARVAGPEPAFPAAVPAGSARTFTWTYTGTVAGLVDLTTTVAGQDLNSGAPVTTGAVTTNALTVVTPGALAAAGSVRALASVGQWFTVSLTVTNTGGATVTGVTPAIAVGPGAALVVQQAAPAGGVTLAAGIATTFAWTYSAFGAGAVTFTMTAAGSTCAATAVTATGAASLTLQTPAVLSAAAAVGPSPRNEGQPFLVTVTVTNTGEAGAGAVATAPFFVGGTSVATAVAGPFPAQPVTLAGGQAVTFTWTYTGTPAGTLVFTTTVSGMDSNAGTTLTVGPAASGVETIQASAVLAAAAAAYRDPLCLGDSTLVTLTISNTGGADAALVTAADFAVSGTGSVTKADGPEPAFPVAIAAGSMRTFSWTYTGASAGPVILTATATGQDANTLAALASPAASTPVVTVVTPGALASAGSVRALASVGPWFTVSLTVTNTGGATVTGVTPAIAVGPGAALVAQQAAPAGGVTLGAGAATTFSWTYSASGAGAVTFTMTAAGSTCAATAVTATDTASLTLQTPAALSAAAARYRDPLCVGDAMLVTLTVTNAGDANAVLSSAPDFSGHGAGAVTKTGGPAPVFPATVPGHGSATFAWTYAGTTAGAVNLSTTVSGTDGNSGLGVTTGVVATPALAVVTPGALAAAASTVPAVVSAGQWFEVRLTVTNTGGAVVTAVTATLSVDAGGPLATLKTAPSPIASLAAGASATFTWTYSAAGAGSLAFTATGVGGTCVAGATVAAAPASIVITAPAGLSAALASFGPSAFDPPFACPTETFLVTLTVTNTGGADAVGVTAPAPAVTGGTGGASMTAGPTPAAGGTLAPGASQTYTWTFTGSSAGSVVLTATPTATDAHSGLSVSGPAAPSPTNVRIPGSLAASLSAPTLVGQGTLFTVVLAVTNTGGALVVGSQPTLAIGPGAGILQLTASSTGGHSFAAGNSFDYSWTFSATGGGPVSFTATVVGTTCAGGTSLAAATVSTTLVFGVPALSFVSHAASPGFVNSGQVIRVVLTVKSTGVGPATAVTPVAPAVSGSGGIVLDSGPTPASVASLVAGQSASFTWDYHATRGGTVVFTTAVASSNGAAVGATSSNAVTIVESGASVAEAEIYPLPFDFKTAQGGTLKFRRLPGNTKIRIYTAAGELTAGVAADGNGVAEWDGRNESGGRVASGVYFYVLEPPKGGIKVGKLEVKD